MQNGYFKLEKRNDGAYLIVYPAVDMGTPCEALEVTRYLDGFNVDYEKNVVYDLVKQAAEGQNAEGRITTLTIGKFDESVSVALAPEAMNAMARFYPPSTGGRMLTREDILHQLGRQGIKFGIIDTVIEEFLNNREYCKSYVLAQAELPKEGRDAVIEYHFNTDLTRKPKMNDDGSVDFHQLDTVSHVEKDMELATLTPAVQGKPGTDVLGRPINPKKVNIKFLRQVKNTHLSPDGLRLICDVSGHVMFVEGQIFVSDTYKVPANVDASTGDIVYNGNVEVAGNVNTGYKIEATGDIIVNGVVEGAELYAGSQIILKRGIQGMSKGVLKAGSNIISKFIESATVTAAGFVQTESIMHSVVNAGAEITVKGRKGFITGGSIRSGKYIDAKTAGSVMGTNTNIEVGVNMNLTEEKKKLESERAELMAQTDKAEKIILFISKKIKEREQLPPDKLEQFKTLSSQKKIMENRIAEIENRIIQIDDELDNSVGGYILIDDIIYPGCKVTVSNVSTFIRTETKHCRLVRDGADVRVKAY